MQFLVRAMDGTDDRALDRRLAARGAYVARSDELIEAGNVLYGVALLDECDRMSGSVMIVDFPDRDAVDAWLQTEPYVTGGVWQKIDVEHCRVGPSFVGLHEKPARA
ncbi:MAG: YciI family protein [Thermoleophilaceae bacterium]